MPVGIISKCPLLTYDPFSKLNHLVLIISSSTSTSGGGPDRLFYKTTPLLVVESLTKFPAFQHSSMESNNTEKKTNGRLSEIHRYLLYAVVVVFLVLCNTFLFLEQQHTKQRLIELEDKMITKETLKKFFPASQSNSADKRERLHGKALFVREKRALALSLESLEKRLKVLEFRWDFVFLPNIRKLPRVKINFPSAARKVMHHCAKQKQAFTSLTVLPSSFISCSFGPSHTTFVSIVYLRSLFLFLLLTLENRQVKMITLYWRTTDTPGSYWAQTVYYVTFFSGLKFYSGLFKLF